jgi:chromosomal replication initiation ATPase DnaA
VAGEFPRQARPAHPQLTLKLAPDPGYEPENFFISQSNEQAFEMIELWPNWPDPLLILIGPAGAGKSHLGAIWVAHASAAVQSASSLSAVDIGALASKGPLLIEDADAIGGGEAQLFHLVNIMRERGTALVLTAKTQPDCWNLRTADLLSRLRLAPSVAIGLPDDELMRAVLLKILIERQLVVDTSIISYIALRLERSLGAARSFVDALDREALARQTRITKAIARDVLSTMHGNASVRG